jgi:hypothetical protein
MIMKSNNVADALPNSPAHRVAAFLKTHGPSTKHEIMDGVGLSFSSAGTLLARLRLEEVVRLVIPTARHQPYRWAANPGWVAPLEAEGAPIPMRKLQYITRDQLADLRDEIEDWYRETQRLVAQCDRSIKHFSERKSTNDNRIEALARDLRKMQQLLGLEPCPQDVGGEHVAWSYFHVWIARINKRLDELELRLNKPV